MEHNKLLETLRDNVEDDGFIMLAGEPIYESASKALPVPMCIRHDCLSMYSILTQGWMELGFEEGYFCELALRTGWLPERHDFSYSERGKAYILRKIKDEIDFTKKFLIKTCKGDCGFFDAESNVRWINEHGYFPIPNIMKQKKCTIKFVNHLPVYKDASIKLGDKCVGKLSIASAQQNDFSFLVDNCADYIEIISEPTILDSDVRTFGIGILSMNFS